LKADVEAFFGRLHADALSDNDIATILEKDAQLVRKRNEVCSCFPPIASLSHMRSLLLLDRRGKR
jgi:hypothetical protein